MLRGLLKRVLKLVIRPEPSGGAPLPPNTTAGTAEPIREAVAGAAAPQPVARWRTRLASLVAAAGGVVIFGLLGVLVGGGHTAEPDLAVTVGVQSAGNPLLLGFMALVSLFGFPPLNVILVLAAMAFFWLAGYRAETGYVALAGVGVGLLATLLKLFWLRPRPAGEDIQVFGAVGGHSFPSGHTLFYVSFFGFLFYWVYAFLKKGRLRTVLLCLLGLLIVLVGPSRIYLGHHWASDVLAAYALGLAYLLVLIRAYGATRLSNRPA
jgi:undecaprenyl-diphosphatase